MPAAAAQYRRAAQLLSRWERSPLMGAQPEGSAEAQRADCHTERGMIYQKLRDYR